MVECHSFKQGQPSEQRADARSRVLKGAKLVFDGSVMDCLVRNISAQGARVSLAVPTALPDCVMLQMPGGAVHQAHRRWSAGTDSGFEFTGGTVLQASAAARAVPIMAALSAASPADALGALHAERCFDDPALQDLAAKLRDAHAALAGALGALAAP